MPARKSTRRQPEKPTFTKEEREQAEARVREFQRKLSENPRRGVNPAYIKLPPATPTRPRSPRR